MIFKVKNISVNKEIVKAKRNFLDTIDREDATDGEIHRSFYRLLYAVNVSNMRYNKVQFYISCLMLLSSLLFLTIFVVKVWG
jgi:hypothetical protein